MVSILDSFKGIGQDVSQAMIGLGSGASAGIQGIQKLKKESNPKFLSIQHVNQILDDRPEDVSEEDLLNELQGQGFTIEGMDDAQKDLETIKQKAEVVNPVVKQNQQSFMSRFGQELKQSGKEVLAPSLGVLQGLSKVGQATVGKIPELITGESVSSEGLFGETEKMGRFTFGEEVGKILGSTALTAPIGGLGALGKGSYFVNLLKNIGLGATEGVVGQGIYNVAGGNDFTKDAKLAGAIGGAIPLLGAGLGAVSKMTGLAEKLQASGLINPERMTYLKNTLIKEGADDLGETTSEDVAKWMIQRDIKGNKDDIVKQLDKAGKESKAIVDSILNQSKTLHNIPQADEALFQIAEDIEKVPGMSEEFLSVLSKLKDGGYTLSELNGIKRDLDNFYKIYKKSGDVKEGLKAQGLDNIRKTIKSYIEDAAQQEGLGNIKLLNNETAMAFGLKDAISKKESADAVREFLGVFSRGTIGGFVGTQTGPFDNKTFVGQAGNFLIGALLGNVAGSTKVRTNVANFVGKLSGIEKKELKRFIGKEIDETQLSEGLVQKIGKLKDSIGAKMTKFGDDLGETIVKRVDEGVPTQRRGAVGVGTPEEVLKNRELADGVISINDVLPYAGNPLQGKTNAWNQNRYDRLKESLKTEELKKPIRIAKDENGQYLIDDGNHRFEVLKEMGKDIPAILDGKPVVIKNTSKIYNIGNVEDTIKGMSIEQMRDKLGITYGEAIKLYKSHNPSRLAGFKQELPYGLTEKEGNSIIEYTNYGYQDKEIIKDVEKAIKKLPDYEGTVYRVHPSNGIKIGQDLNFDEIKSSTKDIKQAENIYNSSGGKRNILQINTTKGKDISQLSNVNEEAEVLIPKGKYKVAGKKVINGLDIYILE